MQVTGQKPSHLIRGSRPSLPLRVKWHTLLREARHSKLVRGGRYKLVRGLELISVARHSLLVRRTKPSKLVRVTTTSLLLE